MTKSLSPWIRALILATLGFVIVVAFIPGRVPVAVRVYALVASALGLGVVLVALGRAYPAEPPLWRQSRAHVSMRRPAPTLATFESETELGIASAFYLHLRLAPRLRMLAAGLLASRRGVSLDHEQDRARRVLGEETWALVRDDRPAPEDRQARGVRPDELASVVRSLERI